MPAFVGAWCADLILELKFWRDSQVMYMMLKQSAFSGRHDITLTTRDANVC